MLTVCLMGLGSGLVLALLGVGAATTAYAVMAALFGDTDTGR